MTKNCSAASQSARVLVSQPDFARDLVNNHFFHCVATCFCDFFKPKPILCRHKDIALYTAFYPMYPYLVTWPSFTLPACSCNLARNWISWSLLRTQSSWRWTTLEDWLLSSMYFGRLFQNSIHIYDLRAASILMFRNSVAWRQNETVLLKHVKFWCISLPHTVRSFGLFSGSPFTAWSKPVWRKLVMHSPDVRYKKIGPASSGYPFLWFVQVYISLPWRGPEEKHFWCCRWWYFCYQRRLLFQSVRGETKLRTDIQLPGPGNVFWPVDPSKFHYKCGSNLRAFEWERWL